MNKKELYSMKLLEATDELVKLAKEDVPVRNKETCKEQLIYQRGLYLRAEIENRILKVHFIWQNIFPWTVENHCIHYMLIKRMVVL